MKERVTNGVAVAALVVWVTLWYALLVAHCPLHAQAPETLTELDKLRIENANLFDALATYVQEADECRGQLARPRAEANRTAANDRRAKLKAEIEKAHPGMVWDPASGALAPKPPETK